jgi:signal transduction histidine kinase
LVEVKASVRENSFQLLAFSVLFAGLAVLAGFFLAGESRRARLLAEYEADRTASALVEAYRNGDEIDPSTVDPRVLGFGIYRSGESLVNLRNAPAALGGGEQSFGFTFDPRSRTLLVVKPLGAGGMGMAGMLPPQAMGRRGGQMTRGPGRAGVAALLMDARGYYRSRALSRAAAVAVPVIVAGLTALFLSLSASNRRYRQAAEDHEMLAKLGEVSHTLAHEIRNPLSAIRIQTALLRRAAGPAASERPLAIIDEEVARLTLLTRRISDYLRDPKGSPEHVAVEPFLRDITARLPWTVQLRLEAGSAQVDCDRELLRSVIENLARNAYESYPEETPAQSREVLLQTALRTGRVAISVCDRGSGIPPERAKTAFTPFVTDKVGGSGIGLAISKRFVEAAGGTLELLPREAGGTQALVLLPSAAVPGDPA